ncbi:hypothetical protein DFJ74DRAFT_253542 [Hyaloraphidium curvatum]|nr:hypothetical protein DFJ74DRAFT_253542 [Hyaloraphidium curvatum]
MPRPRPCSRVSRCGCRAAPDGDQQRKQGADLGQNHAFRGSKTSREARGCGMRDGWRWNKIFVVSRILSQAQQLTHEDGPAVPGTRRSRPISADDGRGKLERRTDGRSEAFLHSNRLHFTLVQQLRASGSPDAKSTGPRYRGHVIRSGDDDRGERRMNPRTVDLDRGKNQPRASAVARRWSAEPFAHPTALPPRVPRRREHSSRWKVSSLRSVAPDPR